jgi:DNA-binding NarL/FixJ family response regulator
MVESTDTVKKCFGVLLVDDHGIVRDGVAALLEKSPRLKVIGQAATGMSGLRAARKLKPDVVVMDLVLPELSGVDATQRILRELPQTRVVILTMCHSREHIVQALRAGALAYVLKRSASNELVHAVLAALDGKRYLSPSVAESIAGVQIETEKRSPLEQLSPREREVLHLAVAGATSAVIAEKLSLSPKTVDTYRSRIMEKLGVSDHTALIHFAIEHAMTPI